MLLTLEKIGREKTCITADRNIYTKPTTHLCHDFCKSTGIPCSFTTFRKYKPFYIGPPTEREKESCLCSKCQNSHLLLRGTNNFRKFRKLTQHDSVTKFTKLHNSLSSEEYEKIYPEFSSSKSTMYYVFEKKTET